MKKEKPQRTPVEPICEECKFPIVKFQKYYRHDNGMFLCADCYKKLKERGEIE